MRFCRNLIEKNDFWIIMEGDTQLFRTLLRYPPNICQSYSEIILHERYALKKIRYQKFADYVRKPFRSQAKREAYSSRWMQQHKILSPKIYGWGFSLFSPSGYESLLLMENIENIGSVADFLKKTQDLEKRNEVILHIRDDLLSFIEHGYLHKDTQFNNLLLSKNLELYWVDNDISKLDESLWKRYEEKMLKSKLLSKEDQKILDIRDLQPRNEKRLFGYNSK
jgi:tRNA A-37 threonylcarbamoyl transferase component Bud32